MNRLGNQGAWVQTGNPFTVSETAGSEFAPGQLGSVVSFGGNTTGVDDGKAPKVIQCVSRYATDTVAMTAGDVAFWQDTDNFIVTGEAGSALGGTTAPLLAGVFGSASPSAGSVGFIQVGGVSPIRLNDSTSSSTVGVPLVWSTTNLVRQATAQDSNRQVLGIGRTLTTATGTHVSAEALLSVARLGW